METLQKTYNDYNIKYNIFNIENVLNAKPLSKKNQGAIICIARNANINFVGFVSKNILLITISIIIALAVQACNFKRKTN